MVESDTEHVTAAQEALRAATGDPANMYALIVAAQALHAAGDTFRATEMARLAAAASMKGAPNIRVLRGASNLLQFCRRYDESAKICRVMVELSPADDDLRLHYALTLLALRDFRSALEQLETHLVLNPESALGWRNHAGALESLGEIRKSLESSSKAIDLDPLSYEFRLHRAGLYNHLGRTADALAEVRRAEELGGITHSSLWFSSIIFNSAGDLDAAILFARRAVELAPDNLDHAHYLSELEKRRFLVSGSQDRLLRAQSMTALQDANAIPLPPRYDIQAEGRYTNAGMNALGSQGRIILALLLRDAKTRFSESRLGYLWALLEPVSHISLIAIVFAASDGGGHPPIGDSFIIYYFTGSIPYLLFSNTIFGIQPSLIANRSILQIPLVQKLDVFLAKGLLELLTQFTIVIIMLTIFLAIGLPAIPNDVPKAGLALFCLWVMAFGIGVTNAVIKHFIKSWEHVFGNVVRVLYFTSGIFFNPLNMPVWLREVLAWNPVLQCVDWVRSGFFQGWNPYWLDPYYAVYWAVGTLTVGLCMERMFRRQLSSAE